MDKFTPDILILGYSGNNTEVRLVSDTGLSPAMVGCSKAVLLPLEFLTSYEVLTPRVMCPRKVKNSSVLSLLPHSTTTCVMKKWFRLCRFRSPLLTVSILFLFHWVLRCFTSPGMPPSRLEVASASTLPCRTHQSYSLLASPR